MDNLYREPKDGMISLRKNNGSEVVIDKNQVMEEGIPEIELVTLIDLSTLWEVNHPNLLNITRNLRYLDNSEMQGGFLQFSSEAPDHISSWKSFCKRPFDLHQTISIFRQLCDGVSHIHDQGMIFRDVHPTRIHLKTGVIKLNLVGMPYNFKKLLKNESFSGHLNYSAPEILESGTENYLS
jgi:serine/threonine protein kinase